MSNYIEENRDTNAKKEPENKPNDTAGFYFSTHIRISDPNSKEILLQKRGDN